MPARRDALLETSHSNITFGYLFYNMKQHLCFTILVEKQYIWAIEHQGDSQTQPQPQPQSQSPSQWQTAGFCPLWWAKKHPANGAEIPDPRGLNHMVLQVVSQRLAHQQSGPASKVRKPAPLASSPAASRPTLAPIIRTSVALRRARTRKHSIQEIHQKLHQATTLMAQGKDIEDIIRELHICKTTYYRWQNLHGHDNAAPS